MMRFPITQLGIAVLAVLLGMSTVAIADEDQPSLRFGISASGAPMASFEHGVLRGLEVDLARALVTELGTQLRLQEMPSARLIDGLRGGRVDLVLSTLPDADLHALGLAASSALLHTGQMALIRTEDAATFGRLLDIVTTSARVGYQRGSAGARFVQANLPNAKRVPVVDATWGIAALRAGDIDIFVHDATTVWAIATNPYETDLLGIFRPLTEERLAWALRAEDEVLERNVNAIIGKWRTSGSLSRLINRWIRVQVEIKR